ncbi:hypothetical protein E3N88_18614 [Mikania micrantha]|uniref:Uncharacterized protein n=1 Tax=Mikania micrantha TaxID=192012 RepID=A0A5N6NNN0_9ASTR|nr:hypothetical protein E3N88_18614 [Mikania micrantha]
MLGCPTAACRWPEVKQVCLAEVTTVEWSSFGVYDRHMGEAAKGLMFKQDAENPSFREVPSLLPQFSVMISLDPLYFHVEEVEGYAWAKESLNLVEKQESYGGLKVKNGGGSFWPEIRVFRKKK